MASSRHRKSSKKQINHFPKFRNCFGKNCLDRFLVASAVAETEIINLLKLANDLVLLGQMLVDVMFKSNLNNCLPGMLVRSYAWTEPDNH